MRKLNSFEISMPLWVVANRQPTGAFRLTSVSIGMHHNISRSWGNSCKVYSFNYVVL